MTLNASGPISLGGTTAGQSAEVELGGTGTAAITMNDSNLRTLAAVGGSGAQWSMNSLYGKSNTPGRSLWGWGSNSSGILGNGTTTQTSTPVQVGALSDWSMVASGAYSTVMIKQNGSLWLCGSDGYGQNLGMGAAISSPVQVGLLTNWKSVSSGKYCNVALKTDGTIWGWGNNKVGTLGQGTVATGVSSPVQMSAATNWSAIAVANGNGNPGSHTLALKTDGTVWGCGYNTAGQLGDNTVVNKSTFVQIGSLTTWAAISVGFRATAMIKTDGSMWACGYNYRGQAGIGVFHGANLSSPVKVLGAQVWASVAVGFGATLAIDTSGKLWACGNDAYNYGFLGLGSAGMGATGVSTFVQVGALTNWASVSLGGLTASAIKTDGTIWGWGANYATQLGTGAVAQYSSPIQIGSLSTWKTVTSSGTSSIFGTR